MGDDHSGKPAAVDVRRLRDDETAELVQCFERCYGRTYVADAFYDAAAIGRLLNAGTLVSVVAVSPPDGIVGHMALTIRHADSRTVDAGNTVVDPRYRGHHLAARLGACLVDLCREHGFVGFHHYPTTAHPVMQKLAVQGGGIETGLMLGYIPPGTEYRELAGGSHASRLAAVVVYQPIAPAPSREVFVPARYRAMVDAVYRQAGLARVVRDGCGVLLPESIGVDTTFDPRRRLRRIRIARAGIDLAGRVEAVGPGCDADIVHVDLSLEDPSVGEAVDQLRSLGFFYCGLLPEFLRSDVLRLQRLRAPDPAVLLPELATDGGRELLFAITRDQGIRTWT